MEKSKEYYRARFSGKVVKRVYELFVSKLDSKKEINRDFADLTIHRENETWSYDHLEEFLAEVPKADRYRFSYIAGYEQAGSSLTIEAYGESMKVRVELEERNDIESTFQIFEDELDKSKLIISKEPVKIFIGHGNETQWRDLKDHLHDMHGFKVIAYEIGPRAGQSVKDVLEEMLTESSIAFLVLTGEDIDTYGEPHARENVIHELGLFQGRLGFSRAIALLEKDVHEFSNILGLNQIRFSKGNIRETFGDVVAMIKREFEDDME